MSDCSDRLASGHRDQFIESSSNRLPEAPSKVGQGGAWNAGTMARGREDGSMARGTYTLLRRALTNSKAKQQKRNKAEHHKGPERPESRKGEGKVKEGIGTDERRRGMEIEGGYEFF